MKALPSLWRRGNAISIATTMDHAQFLYPEDAPSASTQETKSIIKRMDVPSAEPSQVNVASP
jgi:hypothetical protein